MIAEWGMAIARLVVLALVMTALEIITREEEHE